MIHGFFKPHQGELATPYVQVRVRSPEQGQWARIDLLIDTGADATALHPDDARHVLPDYFSREYELDPNRTTVRGIGGAALFVRVDLEVLFPDDMHRALRLDAPLLIASPRATSLFGTPSILGRDVLQHFALHMDSRERTVTLTL